MWLFYVSNNLTFCRYLLPRNGPNVAKMALKMNDLTSLNKHLIKETAMSTQKSFSTAS